MHSTPRTWLNTLDARLERRLPAPAYAAMLRAAAGARTLAGREPGMSHVLPDFVIIGAAKAGTTSVYAWLCEHPGVRRADRKEIHYFSFQPHRGLGWYRRHFPTLDDREHAAADGRPFITGEASPSYMLDPRVPARMARALPDVRLIALLRNPVDRAYSQFHMRRRTGHEPLESFAAALAAEDPGFAGQPAAGHRNEAGRTYLSRGRYAEQLERWLAHFPREQLYVMSTEELSHDPRGALAGLHGFLELPPFPEQPLEPRFTAEYDPMPADDRARLIDYFRPYNRALYELLGKEFAWDR